jgi:hypothetical protein
VIKKILSVVSLFFYPMANTPQQHRIDPLPEPKNWIPVIAGLLTIMLSSFIYESHHSYKILSLIGVLTAGSMIFLMIYSMRETRTLNVIGLCIVYIVWLVRGILIKSHADDIDHDSILSDEQVGMGVSTCLLVLSLFTFADKQKIMTHPIKRTVFTVYILLLIYPHTCSSSYSLHGWRMYIKTACFSVMWLVEDYYYAQNHSHSRLDSMWWLSAWTDSNYIMLLARSVWILFVHEFFLIGIVLIGLACFSEISDTRIPHQKKRDRLDAEMAVPASHSGDVEDCNSDEEEEYYDQPMQSQPVYHSRVNNRRPYGNNGMVPAGAVVSMTREDIQVFMEQINQNIDKKISGLLKNKKHKNKSQDHIIIQEVRSPDPPSPTVTPKNTKPLQTHTPIIPTTPPPAVVVQSPPVPKAKPQPQQPTPVISKPVTKPAAPTPNQNLKVPLDLFGS